MSETIYDSNFAKYLPQPLTHDPKMIALANAAEKELLNISGLAKTVLIYPRIDELPEELLDILAYDLHVDWYDYGYTLETKRNVLKSSVGIHKKMGTKYAVEKALSAVYRTAAVEEWFDYGGKPYHFKVTVDIGDMGLSEETTRQIEEKMWFYKNLRSHCDGIFYAISTKRADVKAAGVQELGARLKVKPLLKNSIKAAGQHDIRAATFFAAAIKVKPLLVARIGAGTGRGVETYLREKNSMKIKPVLPGRIAAKTENAVKANLREFNSLKVKTYTKRKIKADLAAQGSAGAYLRSKQTMTIRKEH